MVIFPRLLPQVDQAVELAVRGRTGNDNRPGRAVGANARALEIVDLIGEQAGQREYAGTRMALKNGLPNSSWGHGLIDIVRLTDFCQYLRRVRREALRANGRRAGRGKGEGERQSG